MEYVLRLALSRDGIGTGTTRNAGWASTGPSRMEQTRLPSWLHARSMSTRDLKTQDCAMLFLACARSRQRMPPAVSIATASRTLKSFFAAVLQCHAAAPLHLPPAAPIAVDHLLQSGEDLVKVARICGHREPGP